MIISLVEPETDDLITLDTDIPQIMDLSVTRADVPVTDLAGTTVTATFPFAVPESWGDPAEIADDSLFAVFADENGKLTAYQAQYDPATGEVTFETDQIGEFVIIRFAYEEELFTEDFYSALAELKEVKYFLDVLKEART